MEIFVWSFIIIIIVASGVAVTSAKYHSRQERYLKKELKVEEILKTKVAKTIGVEGAVVSAVSIFDVLYNTSRMDPHVLKGISHLHNSQEFESLGDLTSYMKENILSSEEGSKPWRQMVHKYKGYTGEEVAFDNLEAAGHEVEVPESGTEEGWDVKIDGEKFNVKITDNPAYIQKHLDENPDIKVITNKEMGEAFSDNPNVIINPDLSVQEAFHTTNGTLDAINDIGDLIDGIPLITLTVSSIKNARRVIKGDKNITTALEHVVCDTAAVGFGGWVGSEIGLGIGLALAPVTGGVSAIVIPVATTFISTIIGILTGKKIVNWFKQRHLRTYVSKLKLAATDFCESFLGGYDRILTLADGYYYRQIRETKQLRRENEGFLKRTFFPSVLSKFYQMALPCTVEEQQKTREYYQELREKVLKESEKSEGAVKGGFLVYAQGKNILNDDKELLKKYDKVDKTQKIVEEEKRKLK